MGWAWPQANGSWGWKMGTGSSFTVLFLLGYVQNPPIIKCCFKLQVDKKTINILQEHL